MAGCKQDGLLALRKEDVDKGPTPNQETICGWYSLVEYYFN